AGLYSHKGPLKIISENGPVSLQANGGPLELLADQAITATSSEGKVSVLAKEKITLQSGEVEIVLDGANIFFRCPGTFTIKGSIKSLEPGQAGSVSIPALPSAKSDLPTHEAVDWIALDYRDPDTGVGIAQADYDILFQDGPTVSGQLDANGEGRHERVDNKLVENVVYKPRTPETDQPFASLFDLQIPDAGDNHA
ncbi:Rhs element Vgr protein, partial [Alcanivorax balearicus MACL04]